VETAALLACLRITIITNRARRRAGIGSILAGVMTMVAVVLGSPVFISVCRKRDPSSGVLVFNPARTLA
jgi:hypothetical protein